MNQSFILTDNKVDVVIQKSDQLKELYTDWLIDIISGANYEPLDYKIIEHVRGNHLQLFDEVVGLGIERITLTDFEKRFVLKKIKEENSGTIKFTI